jgi:hypothetical protein
MKTHLQSREHPLRLTGKSLSLDHVAFTNKVHLGMAGHPRWGLRLHKVPRDTSPITLQSKQKHSMLIFRPWYTLVSAKAKSGNGKKKNASTSTAMKASTVVRK